MPAPLVGLAVATAARLAAKKLAQQAVKKKGLSNTFGGKKTIKKIAMTPKQAALKKRAAVKATDKASVKVVKPSTLRDVKNKTSNVTSQLRKSGEAAKRSAADVRTGMPNATVKIKSGGDIKPAGKTFKRSSLPIIIRTKRPGLFEEGFVNTQYIKSGGNIKPATPKVTRANTSAGVGKAPSKADVKWDMEKAKLSARKGKTVKINSK